MNLDQTLEHVFAHARENNLKSILQTLREIKNPLHAGWITSMLMEELDSHSSLACTKNALLNLLYSAE